MADDKTKGGAKVKEKDKEKEKMQGFEVKYLAKKHDTKKSAVKAAVERVGSSRAKVEAELKKVKK